MTPLCGRCSYLVSQGLPAGGCPSCTRALVHDVAFNPEHHGLTVDRVAAVLIAVVGVVVALFADPNRVVVCAAVAALAAAPYALFSRGRPSSSLARPRVGRVDPHTAAAAAPARSRDVGAQGRPHLYAQK